MASALTSHTIGELLTLRVTALAGVTPTPVNFTAIPVTIVLDAPSGGLRIILRYLNGGTDGVLETGGLAVRFVKLPGWSAINFTPGPWDCRILVGTAAVDQDEVGNSILMVVEPINGALPTTGV